MKLKPKLYLPIVLLVALSTRLIYLIEYLDSPFFTRPVVDAATYLQRAAEIAEGRLLPDGPFWQAPLYEYWLGLQYAIFGESFIAFRIVALLVGMATVGLVYRLARQIAGEKAGFAAGLFYAVYGTAIFFEMELLPAGLAAIGWTAFVSLFIEAEEKGGRLRAFATGITGGLAMLTATTGALAFPALLLYLFIKRKNILSPGTAALTVFSMAAGLAVPLIFTATINYAVSGEPILVSSNAGINYYIGNNADAESTMAIRPGAEWSRLTSEPTRHGARTANERQHYFFAKSFAWAKAHPGDWLLLQLKKGYRTLHGFEAARNVDPYLERGESRLLTWLLWNRPIFLPWGILLPLAFLALFAANLRRLAPALIFLGCYLAGVALFFVAARHRLPVAPILCVIGGVSIVNLRGWGRITGTGRKVAVLLAMHAIAVAVNLPIDYRQDENLARREFLLGQAAYDEGEFNEAVDLYNKAIELADDFASAYNGRGVALNDLGQPAEAVRDFTRALNLMPDFTEAAVNLGTALIKEGRELPRAVELLELVHRDDPQFEGLDYKLAVGYLKLGRAQEARSALAAVPEDKRGSDYAYLLAEVRVMSGDGAQAVDDYLALLRKSPEDPTLLVGLAAAYRKGRDYARARDALDLVLAQEPGHYNALYQLGDIEREQNNCARALTIYRQLLTEKHDAGLHNNIGICLSETGQYREALAAFDEALKIDPTLVRALINKGIMHRFFGEEEQATKAWQRALELDPGNEIVSGLIGQGR